MPAVSVRLPEAVYARLAAVAERSGRSKTALARAAIYEYLSDVEDAHQATRIDPDLPTLGGLFSPLPPVE